MNQISMTKKYTTRDGREVRILAIDVRNSSFPVAAAVVTPNGDERVNGFTADGHYYDDADETPTDLIEVPPFKKNDRVMVRSQPDAPWQRRYFSHLDGTTANCFQSGMDLWTSDGATTPWPECRTPVPKDFE